MQYELISVSMIAFCWHLIAAVNTVISMLRKIIRIWLSKRLNTHWKWPLHWPDLISILWLNIKCMKTYNAMAEIHRKGVKNFQDYRHVPCQTQVPLRHSPEYLSWSTSRTPSLSDHSPGYPSYSTSHTPGLSGSGPEDIVQHTQSVGPRQGRWRPPTHGAHCQSCCCWPRIASPCPQSPGWLLGSGTAFIKQIKMMNWLHATNVIVINNNKKELLTSYMLLMSMYSTNR